MSFNLKNFLEHNPAFVIAEIGKNFIDTKEDQDPDVYLLNAKKLIKAAKNSGVDAVKFQTHNVLDEQINIEITSPHFSGSDRYSWVKRNTEATPPWFWEEIKSFCDNLNIVFFTTPMSRGAAQRVEMLDLPLWKIGSGDIGDYVLIDYLLGTKKPIIISTGMTSFEELDKTVTLIEKNNSPLSIMYCVSKYPAPPDEFNLATIEDFKERYPNTIIGFSDHSVDSHEVDLAAIKYGAQIIEKHFSFSRDLWGSDHKASITPTEMESLVRAIKNKEYKNVDAKKYYGLKGRPLSGKDSVFRAYFNKTLISAKDLKIGEIVGKEAVFAMRPRSELEGLPSESFYDIVGKKILRPLKKFQPLKKGDFE